MLDIFKVTCVCCTISFSRSARLSTSKTYKPFYIISGNWWHCLTKNACLSLSWFTSLLSICLFATHLNIPWFKWCSLVQVHFAVCVQWFFSLNDFFWALLKHMYFGGFFLSSNRLRFCFSVFVLFHIHFIVWMFNVACTHKQSSDVSIFTVRINLFVFLCLHHVCLLYALYAPCVCFALCLQQCSGVFFGFALLTLHLKSSARSTTI